MRRSVLLASCAAVAVAGCAAAEGSAASGSPLAFVLLAVVAAAIGAALTAVAMRARGGTATTPAPPPAPAAAQPDDAAALAAELRALRYCSSAFAHDLKGPLNSMVLTAELLRLGAEQDSDDAAAREKRRRHARSIGEEIRKLDGQLRVLLAHLAPVETVDGALDLGALLRDLRALITPQATRQRVVVRAEGAEGVRVTIDAARVRQALLEVLVGALAAMPAGGELGITLLEANDRVAVVVSDTGSTIADGDPYAATARALAAIGGELQVERRAGAGVRVTLTLPRRAAAAS